MDDIHQLLSKFGALADAFESELVRKEQERTGRRLPEPERLRIELSLHEDALAIAAERQRELEARRADAQRRRDHADTERLDALLAEIAREVPLLHQAIGALRQQLDALPKATS